ncbi:hypothetical protein [Gulosibacter sediminis]|uniref:hypothetical protein n=1 Tax=Gulosibacter sediminis TaxID=1729695 RepID=UPI001866AE1B|nr:hypothetical protein [Gulosibacter sediminis]
MARRTARAALLAAEHLERDRPSETGLDAVPLSWFLPVCMNPGEILLGPLAIPTHFTVAMLVGMGAKRGRVLLWQVVAIVRLTVALALMITRVTTVVLR